MLKKIFEDKEVSIEEAFTAANFTVIDEVDSFMEEDIKDVCIYKRKRIDRLVDLVLGTTGDYKEAFSFDSFVKRVIILKDVIEISPFERYILKVELKRRTPKFDKVAEVQEAVEMFCTDDIYPYIDFGAAPAEMVKINRRLLYVFLRPLLNSQEIPSIKIVMPMLYKLGINRVSENTSWFYDRIFQIAMK